MAAPILTLADRKRLLAILGMLGSNAAGEHDNAARAAEKFRRQHGLSWADMLILPEITYVPPPAPPPPEPATPPPPPPAPAWEAPEASSVCWDWDGIRVGLWTVFSLVAVGMFFYFFHAYFFHA